MRWLLCCAAISLAPACSSDDDAELVPAIVSAGDDTGAIDAGDEAFVKRVVPLLWGRKPGSTREVAVLVQLTQQLGREGLLRAMARSPEYVDRWSLFIKDMLHTHRIHAESSPGCYGRRLRPDDAPGLAALVRDQAPGDKGAGTPFTGLDLIRSAVALDDISPALRFHLFGDLYADWFTPDAAGARAARNDRAEIFMRGYLNRRLACMGCHHSKWAITDSPDPLLDRHWPLRGYFELALFGAHEGQDIANLRPFFRRRGVVAGVRYDDDPISDGERAAEWANATAPWGADDTCGRFLGPQGLHDDDLGEAGYLGGDAGSAASIWDLEAKLHHGFQLLRGGLKSQVPATGEPTVDPDLAFATLVSVNVVEELWQLAFGSRLTVAHHFPRNRFQRDALVRLLDTFALRFSIVDVLVAITAEPGFNLRAPADMDGAPSVLAPHFDGWVEDDLPPDDRRNALGDLIHRHDGRTLLRSAFTALRWTPPPEFLIHYRSPDANLLRSAGVYLKDADAGFSGHSFASELAWEDAFGACADRSERPECPLAPILAAGASAESTRCAVCGNHAEACAWDDRCCAMDWESACSDECLATADKSFLNLESYPSWPTSLGPGDFVTDLLEAAPDSATLGDAVAALRDRLLTDPMIRSDAEAAALEALLERPLDSPLMGDGEAEDRLRRACAVMLASPQFMLAGWPGPDSLGAAPSPIVVPETSFAAHCQALTATMFAAGQAQCESDTVVVAP